MALAVDVVGGPGRDPAVCAACFEGFGGGGVALEELIAVGGWKSKSAGAQAEEEGGEDVHVADFEFLVLLSGDVRETQSAS